MKATEAIALSTVQSANQDQVGERYLAKMGTSTAHKAPRPCERHDAYCRMSSALTVLRLISAICWAVRPTLSASSMLALARIRVCTHAACPSLAAIIRAVLPSTVCRSGLAECCSSSSRMEG